jgi:small redox-active disulfide protein 2
MILQVFGPGCAGCDALYEIVERAVAETAADAAVQRVQDIEEIMASDVLMVPSLAIDGRVVLAGRVPGLEEVKRLIHAAGGGKGNR